MIFSLLMLVLLSADPGSDPSSPSAKAPLLVVVVTWAPGREKTATKAGRTLGIQLSAPYVEWSGYLKARGKGCAEDSLCLLAAPGVAGASRLVHLRLRPLPAGRLAMDVRLVDVRGRKVLGRSASVREPGELSSWVGATTTRLLTQADPDASTPPPSPYALPPASPRPSGGGRSRRLPLRRDDLRGEALHLLELRAHLQQQQIHPGRLELGDPRAHALYAHCVSPF